MSKVYVYSTLSNHQKYALDNGTEVLIAGRANVANKNLITPKGVVTVIDEDTLNLLQSNKVFAAHSRNGFISCDSRKEDPEEHAKKNMEAADKSAQATKASLAKSNKAAKVKDE